MIKELLFVRFLPRTPTKNVSYFLPFLLIVALERDPPGEVMACESEVLNDASFYFWVVGWATREAREPILFSIKKYFFTEENYGSLVVLKLEIINTGISGSYHYTSFKW